MLVWILCQNLNASYIYFVADGILIFLCECVILIMICGADLILSNSHKFFIMGPCVAHAMWALHNACCMQAVFAVFLLCNRT